MENYSVLMSVYAGADQEHFDRAIESMLSQTAPTNNFVIVCDGPLTPALDAVLDSYAERYPSVIVPVRLPQNVGVGKAANEGLAHCKNDLVAKMDADDVSVSNRAELQLAMFKNDPDLAVCGGFIEEFGDDPDLPHSVRAVPTENEDIRRFAKRRQPFNNMTVMYRRSAVLDVGGYRDYRRSEDYDLYIRLLHAGYKAANLKDVLVKARVDTSAYSRRASFGTLQGCVRSRWRSYRIGYSSLVDVCICVVGEFVIIVSPPKLQQYIYRKFLRKGCDESDSKGNVNDREYAVAGTPRSNDEDTHRA